MSGPILRGERLIWESLRRPPSLQFKLKSRSRHLLLPKDIVIAFMKAVDLRGKSLRQHAEAIISIAHPSFREEVG